LVEVQGEGRFNQPDVEAVEDRAVMTRPVRRSRPDNPVDLMLAKRLPVGGTLELR
jgi:hypothetical protein